MLYTNFNNNNNILPKKISQNDLLIASKTLSVHKTTLGLFYFNKIVFPKYKVVHNLIKHLMLSRAVTALNFYVKMFILFNLSNSSNQTKKRNNFLCCRKEFISGKFVRRRQTTFISVIAHAT